jgi:hypothetical protein
LSHPCSLFLSTLLLPDITIKPAFFQCGESSKKSPAGLFAAPSGGDPALNENSQIPAAESIVLIRNV